MQTYEQAAINLQDLIGKRSIRVRTHPLPRLKEQYRDPIGFIFTVTNAGGTAIITGTYQAGIGLAASVPKPKGYLATNNGPVTKKGWDDARAWMRNGGRLSIFAAALVYELIKAYRPEPIVVIGSLLSDQSCIEEYDECDDWLGAMGYTESLAKVREGEQAWNEIKGRTRHLKTLFGADYRKALELSQEL
ncbi:MAG: hypothetical protein KDB61_00860 [Planctomycetes bacterium]|nr:hypothetical protein [Planctomycetota bacterium]